MSALPSISHRLFVAALEQEQPARPRSSRASNESRVRAERAGQSADADLVESQNPHRPLTGEISATVLVTET